MSIKKYRMCLLMLTLLVVVAGIWIYFYNAEQEKTYRDGTLVYREYLDEGEFA